MRSFTLITFAAIATLLALEIAWLMQGLGFVEPFTLTELGLF